MNNYITTQKDIDILMQSDKTLFYKLELLNRDMKILDCIEGNLINDSISISADSDIRRTYNCTMFVSDSTFDISYGKRFFFDRLIKPYIGILHQRSQEIQWYLLGTFIFVDTNFSYDTSTKNLSLTCNDMMCLLNGTIGGNLSDYQRTIKANSSARSVIIDLLKETGITKYYIEFNVNNHIASDFQIPYDMVYNAGTSAYTIINDIVNLYAGTEFYFSKEGICIIDRIPTSENEIVVLNDDILQQILISEQLSISFKDIFNDIEIFGYMQEPEFYSSNVSYANGVYSANVVAYKLDKTTNEMIEILYDTLDDFDSFSFKLPCANIENTSYININKLGDILIVDETGKAIPANMFKSNTDYVFRYRKESNDFIYLSQYQAHARMYVSNNINNHDENTIVDVNNEYAVEKIGNKLKVLSGNDYERIYSDDLCKQRCKYELRRSTSNQIALNLNTIAIPWLDVNQVIEFTSNSNNKKEKYIINNISVNYVEYTMNILCSKYFPLL